MRHLATIFASLACCLALTWQLSADDAAPARVTVGMTHKIEQLVLPGGELAAKPIDRDMPIVVRIVESFPHGSDTLYDLEFYGLEPGEYNLADYLQRADGSAAELPASPVVIESVLPPGQVTPHELTTTRMPRLGGYTLLLILLGIVWPLGLIAIIIWIVRGFIKPKADLEVDQRIPVADRLRPLVEAALRDELDQPQQALLERTLVMFWRDRLNLQDADAADALATLREHQEAGELLRHLEAWLHQPPARRPDLDVARLLAPYQKPSPHVTANV